MRRCAAAGGAVAGPGVRDTARQAPAGGRQGQGAPLATRLSAISKLDHFMAPFKRPASTINIHRDIETETKWRVEEYPSWSGEIGAKSHVALTGHMDKV